MWEAMRFQDIMQKSGQPKLMVVHCTHGFNRTGYMIANFIMRVGINVKYSENTLEEALNKFAHTRSPGIYKDHYIEQLYKYHHMRRCGNDAVNHDPSDFYEWGRNPSVVLSNGLADSGAGGQWLRSDPRR
jgi:hypothetical protein